MISIKIGKVRIPRAAEAKQWKMYLECGFLSWFMKHDFYIKSPEHTAWKLMEKSKSVSDGKQYA